MQKRAVEINQSELVFWSRLVVWKQIQSTNKHAECIVHELKVHLPRWMLCCERLHTRVHPYIRAKTHNNTHTHTSSVSMLLLLIARPYLSRESKSSIFLIIEQISFSSVLHRFFELAEERKKERKRQNLIIGAKKMKRNYLLVICYCWCCSGSSDGCHGIIIIKIK